MIEFLTSPDLATLELGEFSRKSTSIEGEQMEASRELWQSKDGMLSIGIWECTAGRFSADRANNSETCHLISGSITLRGEDGQMQDLKAGDMLTLPRGWRGEWTLHETTRKLYVHPCRRRLKGPARRSFAAGREVPQAGPDQICPGTARHAL